MTNKILVTGAPGNVGTEVVRRLQKAQIDLRIGAYDVQKARTVFGSEIEIVQFDFLDPTTYAETFVGVNRMFLVRPPALANVQRDIAPALQAAVRAGVQHIVFLSIQGVEHNRVVPHYKIEQLILSLGVNYTFLRSSFFMQNLSTTHLAEIRDHNEIAVPVGSAKTSFIDVRDIAAVAVHALTEDDHMNRAYTLTGEEALNYDEVAKRMTTILDRPIRYTNPSVIAFMQQQLAGGSKIGYALVVTALYTITRFGNAAEVTQQVRHILGRPAIGFDQFVFDYRDCWLPSSL